MRAFMSDREARLERVKRFGVRWPERNNGVVSLALADVVKAESEVHAILAETERHSDAQGSLVSVVASFDYTDAGFVGSEPAAILAEALAAFCA